MEFKKLEKQLLATAKAFRAFKTEFGYGKSGEELLKPFFRSLEESLGAVETEFDFLIGKDTVNINGKSLGARAEAGDTIIFDVSVKFNGRWSDVCRTFFVGEMNGLQKSTYKSINSTISVGKDSLETGVEAKKIYEAVNACYAKSGKTGDSSLDESNKSSESGKKASGEQSDKIVGMVVFAPRLSLKTRRNTCRHRVHICNSIKSRRDEQTLVAAALCFVRHNFKKFVRNY